MQQINLLDCTLRDGGYVNDWNFGHSTTICIFERLVSANLDIIEVGFLDDRREFDINRTIQPTTDCYDKIFEFCHKNSSLVFAMIDFGTCKLENISQCKDTFLDGIRLIFKKPNSKAAIEYGKELMKKGYKVCFQLVSITSYDDRDILDFVEDINKINPYMVSIVDTYGLLHNDEMLHYFHLLNHNLNLDISLGYHAHNNFQLAYSNCVEMLKKSTQRTLAVDGTVYGIGKSAGNAPLELLSMHLNKTFGKQYDIDQILETIDVNILKIYSKKYWGYNLLYYLSALNDCHPNYIEYLLSKKTLSVKAINNVVKNISPDYKLDYNQKHIETLYSDYQKNVFNDKIDFENLFSDMKNSPILVLGPGKTISSQENTILNYIEKHKPIVFSANFIPKKITSEYIFISNSKRYSIMLYDYKSLKNKCKIIATSNVTSVNLPFDYILSYEKLLDSKEIISDNSLIMLLNAFRLAGIRNVTLAGFDGFADENLKNYYDEYMELSDDFERLLHVNVAIKERLSEIGSDMEITFITQSLYNS